MIKAGRKMLLKSRLPYIADNVNVPSDWSALIELCKFAAPMKAVKFTMKAELITKMFFIIRHRSDGSKSGVGTFTNCPDVSVLSVVMIQSICNINFRWIFSINFASQ